ncbi:MAG: ribosome-binding factor A [Granulosicoccus sp.]|jgi:ribosome-binding factor A
MIKKENKRQQQMGELVRREFSVVLQELGGYIYGHEIMVTVTQVKVTADFGLAKIYLSIFNTENKQAVLLLMEKDTSRLKAGLAARIRKKVRRMPHINFYIDETIDEMYRVADLFDKLEKNNQLGSEEE